MVPTPDLTAPPINPSFFGFFRLIRSLNLLIIAFTQYMVKIFVIDEQLDILGNLQNPTLFFLSLSTVCIAAAGYAINDYYDVKIDNINKPDRVVVGRLVKRRVVLLLNFSLNAAGVLLGLWINPLLGFVNFWAIFLLWAYSNHFKRLPFVGNFTIALLTAFSVWILLLVFPGNTVLVGLYAFLAFLISLIREIIKDMEDRHGDARFGCRTLPIIWGIRRTKVLIQWIFAFFLLSLSWILVVYWSWFNSLLALMTLPLLLHFMWRFRYADTKREFAYISTLCKWIMLAGVLTMVGLV
jgi:4-hydroxybenzoate polyprenyltransferase